MQCTGTEHATFNCSGGFGVKEFSLSFQEPAAPTARNYF